MYRHEELKKIRKRVWYGRFKEIYEKVEKSKSTADTVDFIWDILDGARAFRYEHVARSAEEAMKLVCMEHNPKYMALKKFNIDLPGQK